MLHLINKIFIFFFFFLYEVNAEDIISSDAGGKVIHWTLENHPNVAINIIDKNKHNFWSSGEPVFPQVITFSLPKNRRFEGFSITAKNSNNPNTWAKKIRISSADPFPHMGGWVELVVAELPKNGEEMVFRIEPTRGRFFRLEIFTVHGEYPSEVSLSNFAVYDIIQ